MLRGHGSRRENVVRHEVKRFEARAIPRQDFDNAVCERHQHGRAGVRRAGPVRVEVREHGRRIILLAFPPCPILLGAPPHVTWFEPVMGRLVGATVDEILAVRSGLCLLRRRLSLISLRSRIGRSRLRLVSGGLSGLGRIIRLDSRIRGVSSGLVGHSHPSTAIPTLRRVRASSRVNPQGRSLAHRRGRCRALDEHVGLAVSHASRRRSRRIRLLRSVGRVRGGLGRTVCGGLRLRRHARSVRSGGLRIGRIGLRGGSVRLGGSRVGLGRIGRSIGRVRQSLGIASGLFRAFGGGLGGIGGILGLTCGGGRALRGSVGRVGGILRCLRRTICRICRALRVFRCGSGILSSLLRVGGLSRIVRDIRLSLGNLVRVLLDIGIAEMVPIRAIPDKRIDYAVGERHQNARRSVRSPLPVRVKVGHEAGRIILLAFPPRPILLRLEPQVADDEPL